MRSLLIKRALFLVLSLALISPAAAPFTATAQVVVAPPTFSAQRGFYETAFNLTLTAAPGTTIFYSLDGGTPEPFPPIQSPVVGTAYTAPIAITTSTVVRAIAYTGTSAATAVRSTVVTNSYIFPAAVRTQSDTPLPGWPNIFAITDLNGTYPADYEMDPDVVNHALNSSKFTDVLKALPSISLVTDLPNLWHATYGIYLNPNARGNSPLDPLGKLWERPTSIEWINPDGTTGFTQIANASIDGQTSRRPHRQPKKNFRLAFGPTGGLDFDLFDASVPASTFDQLILRNGGNRSWSYFDRDQRREADYINDEFARRAWLDMGNLAPHGTYVHVYLNGLYWGLYNVTEHLNPAFLSSYTGQPAASFDIVQAGDDTPNVPMATSGTATGWNEVISLLSTTDPVSDTLYADIAARVDVVNLADYMIHAHYIGKTDWPGQNWNAYRSNTGPDTRFKFTPLDNDTGLNKPAENVTLVTDTLGFADSPDSVFRRLLTNNEFRQVLADRFYKHVVSVNGALETAACNTRYNELATLVDQAVIAESARWGDYMRDKYPVGNNAPKARPAYIHSRDLPDAVTNSTGTVTVTADIKTWVEVRDAKLASYCPPRDTNVTNQYVTNGWYPNTLLPPSISQAGGMINAGSNVTLGNSPNGNVGDIYYTTDGTDPRAPGGAVAGTATLGNDSASFPINAITTVKARVLSGAAWSPLLEQTFFIQQAFNNLVINEIHYGPVAPLAPAGLNPNDYGFIELHNRGGSAIQLQGVTFSSGIFYQFGAGVNIPANDYLVLASNATRFQERYGFAPDGVYTGSLLNSGETVELSDPAGGLIDTVAYNKVGEPWPVAANAGGGSLSLTIGAANNALATSWFASPINGGTPGEANNSDMGRELPTINTANPAPAITYGTPLQLTATATDGNQQVAGTFTFNPPLGTVLNAGLNQSVQVIFEPSDSISYAGVNTSVTITVNKAPLTITAVNKVKAVGAPNPVLEASYSGFVNGDSAAVLDVAPALSTTAVTGSPIGDYPITVSGAVDNNYAITFVGGILTVTNKIIPTITWPEPVGIVYGTPLSATQLNATATANGQPVAGTFTYTPAAGTMLQAGNDQALSVVFTPTDTTTFIEVNASVAIDVAQAPLTIKAANKVKLVRTENPVLTATYTGFVNGDTVASLDAPVILSTTAQTNSPIGIYPITASGAADANYAITFVNGTMTVATEITNPPGEHNIYLPLVVK
jgi:hypothetical protein